MDFPFDLNLVLPFEVTIINADYQILNPGQTARIYGSDKLTRIIDVMGHASFRAQQLSGPVTTSRKFRSSEHRLYIIKNSTSVIGILKVGSKHLYIYDSQGHVHERTPLCVLDFYVHESKQRLGYGKRLFDTMLEFEKCLPHQLAIDWPSNKCLAFLSKHYRLSGPIHQVTNFVVFPAFFNSASTRNDLKNSNEQDFDSWLFSSRRQTTRPYSEQHENEFFSSRQPSSMSNVRFNHSSLSHSASLFTPRSYSYADHNEIFESLNNRSFSRHRNPPISPDLNMSTSWRLFGEHSEAPVGLFVLMPEVQLMDAPVPVFIENSTNRTRENSNWISLQFRYEVKGNFSGFISISVLRNVTSSRFFTRTGVGVDLAQSSPSTRLFMMTCSDNDDQKK